jgi:hypothetical protein
MILKRPHSKWRFYGFDSTKFSSKLNLEINTNKNCVFCSCYWGKNCEGGNCFVWFVFLRKWVDCLLNGLFPKMRLSYHFERLLMCLEFCSKMFSRCLGFYPTIQTTQGIKRVYPNLRTIWRCGTGCKPSNQPADQTK